MGAVPADFIQKWGAYFQALPTIHYPTVAMGIGSLVLILLLRRFFPKIPWGIATIVVATLVYLLFDIPLQTIESRFGELPRTLPMPAFPSLYFPSEKLQEYFFDGLAIAFLGSIESLLSAVIADGMIGGRHKSNCELLRAGDRQFCMRPFWRDSCNRSDCKNGSECEDRSANADGRNGSRDHFISHYFPFGARREQNSVGCSRVRPHYGGLEYERS